MLQRWRQPSTLALALILVYALIARARGSALADHQFVTCNSTTTWMNNVNGESPCTVASDLMVECNANTSASFVIHPLNASGESYDNPFGGQPCTCNTVVYNLMSACAICQGGSSTSFPVWTNTCTSVSYDYPDGALADSYKTPKWAYVNVSSIGTFDLAAAENVAGVSKSKWSPMQIALPVIMAVVVALLAGVLFYFYRRRLKRRYLQLSDAAPTGHQHQEQPQHQRGSHYRPNPSTSTYTSSSSLRLDRLFGGAGASADSTLKRKLSAVWEPARLQAPRRLGGLLPDRRAVHSRTRGRGGGASMRTQTRRAGDADVCAKDGSSSGHGHGHGHSKAASGSSHVFANLLGHVQGRSSTTSLHSRASSGPAGAGPGAEGVLYPIQDSPALNTARPTPGVARSGRQRPVHVISSPPARGFNLDGTDSTHSSALPSARGQAQNSVLPPGTLTGAGEGGGNALRDASGARAGSGEDTRREPEVRPDGSVLLISRAPGQDFNSMVSPVETDGIGPFHTSTEDSEYWPAALTDTSSVLPHSPHSHSQQGNTQHSLLSQSGSPLRPPQPPTTRIVVPSPHADHSLLVPSSVRAAGGYALLSAFGYSLAPFTGTTSLLPNARLFNNALSPTTATAMSPATAVSSSDTSTGVTSFATAATGAPSAHSSEAYTIPNPFTFDSRRSAGAQNPLRLPASPVPALPGGASKNPFRDGRTASFDLDA